ncbi:precorrin-6Y C5,15-methyltransferase (decarboxylating) subunit CbiT, partial [Candidatus Bathyarchaeota archaeon]
MAKNWIYKTPGIPDELFNQSEEVPGPTKEEIRVVTIAKARLREGDVVIDIGCGTGGLTVEAALQVAPKGKVYAIDEDEAAIKLTKSNVEKFGIQGIVSISGGRAPQALLTLPNPDVIIIGGVGVSLRAILQIASNKLKSNGRIVINAILLETATLAIAELKEL